MNKKQHNTRHLKLCDSPGWLILCVTCVFTTLVVGCASVESSNKDTLTEINAALQDANRVRPTTSSKSAPPREVTAALMPQYQPRLPKVAIPSATEERFDLTVNRMLARTFFMSLVRGTSINLVVHPDVKGRISLDLKNVTIDEVLEVARDVYGYEYQRNRAGYLVLPARLQSRIFNVAYLNVARKGQSKTRVTSGQLSTTESSGKGQSGNNNNSSSGGRSSVKAFASSKIETESKADFWDDLKQTIQALIGITEGRSVVVSPQSGLVVVRAMPGELREVEEFLNRAELNLHRQVIIEAKVIEVSLSDNFQSGINWAKLNDGISRDNFASQFDLFDGQSEMVNAAGQFLTSGVTGTALQQGVGNIFALGTASNDFAMIIRLLDQQGNVNVLSSPRVSTVNNQKAVIKVGSDEFFVTEISSTTTTGTSTTTTPNIILTPFFSGIALDVTPQINDQQEVILHIHPTISEVVDQTKAITVAGQDQSLPLAFSTVRESDSIVKARNGQVIVIGGLMQNQTRNENAGLPGLKKVPILSYLFSQKQKQSRRSELVILLKPTVIGEDQKQWRTEIRELSDRINTFGS